MNSLQLKTVATIDWSDQAADTPSFAKETLELALAHTILNKAEAASHRQDLGEKRVKLMQQRQQQHVLSAALSRGVVARMNRKST